jgi:hypothetical protein
MLTCAKGGRPWSASGGAISSVARQRGSRFGRARPAQQNERMRRIGRGRPGRAALQSGNAKRAAAVGLERRPHRADRHSLAKGR